MKSIITSIAFLVIVIISFGQDTDFTKLDSFFITLEENDRFFGSVAVSRAGEIIYSNAIGYANKESKLENNTETKFRIGSISKTFTATLIMQAVEKGKIQLDETIDKYFPIIQNADQITVRHLLNHRSGIVNFTDRDYLSWYTQPITQSKLLDSIAHRGIDFAPDTDYSYSNSNYVLLTFILEKTLKKPFATILEENIVKPLGLAHTSYGAEIHSDQNEAKSYNRDTDWIEEPETDMSIPLGAGGIISTPTDLCRFAKALYTGSLISKESLDKMKPADGEEYGFALYEMEIDELSGLGHGGAIDAFTSTFTYFEQEDISFALSCNGANFGKQDIAIAVLSEVFGKPYDLPSFEFVELSSEELNQYLGTYETDDLPMDMIVTKEGNTLLLQATGQSTSPILAEGNHKFSAMQYGVKIEFVPSDKKMLFEQQGMAFEFSLKEAEKATKPISENLDNYLGVYETDAIPLELTITKKGNMLFAVITGQTGNVLVAEGNNKYSIKEYDVKMTFLPSEKKIDFEQQGHQLVWTMKQTSELTNAIGIDLDQYIGTYESALLPMDLTISVEDGSLIGQGTGQPSFPLEKKGEHVFSNMEIGLEITFDPKGKKMQFEQGGAEFVMTLEK